MCRLPLMGTLHNRNETAILFKRKKQFISQLISPKTDAVKTACSVQYMQRLV